MDKRPYLKPVVESRKVTLGVYGNYGDDGAGDPSVGPQPGGRSGNLVYPRLS